jgi:CheY-like chemotaxis protein
MTTTDPDRLQILAAAFPRPLAPANRILVVDDHADTVESMAMLLRLLGHEVRVALDGRQAIEIARVFRPDTVLLDLGLPGMSGFEVARRLREEDACKAALLIAVTGYGQEEDRRRTREAGFDAHLLKPADPDTLKALLTTRRPT